MPSRAGNKPFLGQCYKWGKLDKNGNLKRREPLRELKELALPESLEELWAKKAYYGEKAVVIAGGTDLVPASPQGVECLIDIRQLGLDEIKETYEEVRIGATATMEDLSQSPAVASLGQGMLCQSSSQGWPSVVRSTATLGGNLAGGDPFADTPAALLALDAQIVMQTKEGERLIPIDEFFLDYRKTAASLGVLTEIRIPKTSTRGKGIFLKCAPSSVDKALVNIAVFAEIHEGHCSTIRVAVGAVTRIPHRIPAVETFLKDSILAPPIIEEAATVISSNVEPMLDMRASIEKRQSMLSVLLKRALQHLNQAS